MKNLGTPLEEGSLKWYKRVYLDNLIMNKELVSFILTLFLGLIAITSKNLFFLYGFQLISILNLFPTLKSIISAIVSKAQQIFLVGLFLLVVVYSFTTIGFFFYEVEFDELIPGDDGESVKANYCNDLFGCFLFIMDYGIRNGGGIADVLPNKNYFENGKMHNDRFFYDLSFWFFVIVIMLNIVMGIVIDTFTEMREKVSLEEDDKLNTCMICGKRREFFEKFNKNFEYHRENEHNPWNYIF
jgi:hypothetical protein